MNTKKFDKKDYENRLASNQELMVMVAREFINEAGGLLEQLSELIEQQKWSEVARMAHRIKGASVEVSGRAMHDCAREVEISAKQEKSEGIADRVNQLMEEYRELEAELKNTILS